MSTDGRPVRKSEILPSSIRQDSQRKNSRCGGRSVRIPAGGGRGLVSGRREIAIGKSRGTGCGGSIDFADRGSESEISQPRPIKCSRNRGAFRGGRKIGGGGIAPMRRSVGSGDRIRSEEHTSELQSRRDLVCRLL